MVMEFVAMSLGGLIAAGAMYWARLRRDAATTDQWPEGLLQTGGAVMLCSLTTMIGKYLAPVAASELAA